ncbi:MAG: hypothetical protein AAFY64_12085, partial [Pseudomonadota bacterium]
MTQGRHISKTDRPTEAMTGGAPAPAQAHQMRGGAIEIPTAKRRAKALRAARRNTARVKMLRIIFPTLIVGLLATYGIFLNASLETADQEQQAAPKLTFDGPIVTKAGLGMTNPRYEGFNKDGSRFVVTAAKAIS